MDFILSRNCSQLEYIALQHKSSCGMFFANAIIVPVLVEWQKYLGCVAIMSQNIAGGVPSAFGIYTQTPMAMDFSNDIINNANSLSKIVTGEE